MKRSSFFSIPVVLAFILLALGASTLADEPIDSASIPEPPDSLIQFLTQTTGSGIVLPYRGRVELTIMKTETSSLEDILGLESPISRVFTTNARNCVGCTWDVDTFEAETELVFYLDNENPYTGPNQVTIYPNITGSYPLWTLNFEDWFDMDWDDVICAVRLYPDTLIKIKEVSVFDDIDIEGIGDSIWKGTYDQKGDLIRAWKGGPLADAMREGNSAGTFKVKVSLEGFPSLPSETPQVHCKWCFSPTLPVFNPLSGEGDLNANNEIRVIMPQMVGEYGLDLTFVVKDDSGNVISSQDVRGITAYITYSKPTMGPVTSLRLEKAVNWASPSNTEGRLVDNLNASIYWYGMSRWYYRDVATSWEALLDEDAYLGNCYSFSYLWCNVSKLLGLHSTTVAPYKQPFLLPGQGGRPAPAPFLTKPATSMDGLEGNVRPCGTAIIERWMFISHQIGHHGKTNNVFPYYDPTFGDKYMTKTDYVQWRVVSIDSMGNYLDDANHRIKKKEDLSPWNPWGLYCYEDLASGTIAMGGEHSSPYLAVLSADSGVDVDGNGLFNYLSIEVDVNVDVAGRYFITGWLASDSIGISSSPSVLSMLPTSQGKYCEVGIATFELRFSGEEIYQSGVDGNFTAVLSLFEDGGNLIDTASFVTSAYDHVQFRELPGSITGATDYGEDTDSDGQYDYLAVDVSLEVVETGVYAVQGILFADSTYLTAIIDTSTLQVGSNSVTLRFAGTEIRDGGFDGPYTVELYLSDPTGHQNDSKDFQTSSYSHTGFDPRNARFTDSFNDFGVDINANGLFDFLTIEADIEVEEAGHYRLTGWVADSIGPGIATSDSSFYFAEGTHTAALRFDGKLIYQQGINGPYVVSYITIEDENGAFIDAKSEACTTSAYSYTAFEKPQIEVTGGYSDYGWYPWILPYWWLAVNVEVVSAKAGYVSISADLYDANGEKIVATSALEYMPANIPQMIRLQFDGRRIYGSLEDGPYYVKDLVVYHAEDPSQAVRISEAYTTSAYSYTEFSPAAVILGTVTETNGTPIANALLSIYGWDKNYSDENGEYKLSVLENGTYTLRIEGPSEPLIESWVIYVNNDSVGVGDSLVLQLAIEQITHVDFRALAYGSIEGTVSDSLGGLLGVTVDLYDSDDNLINVTSTGQSGAYAFDELMAGNYTISIVSPLGFIAGLESKSTTVTSGAPSIVDFALSHLDIVPQQRSKGYWKHQVSVHLSGRGHAQESLADMSSYMDLIKAHFNSNLVNPITIFEVPQPATQIDSLQVLKDLLTANGNADMNDRAIQQLIALMLNVVSLKLHQTTPISEDSTTVSQAITYCNQLITDSDENNDEIAKDIADYINNGVMVDSGMIPLATLDIMYKATENETIETVMPREFSLSQNYPNPFNPTTEISFSLPSASHVKLEVFNVMGQKVATLVNEQLEAGEHTVPWDGSNVASGVYLYRLQAAQFVDTKKMILLK